MAALINNEPGRVGRRAATILRRTPPSPPEVTRLAAVARAPGAAPGLRLRMLAILRASRWEHLAIVLE